MNPSKKPKKGSKTESLPKREPGDDTALKLEIWENEGGAIDQPNVRKNSKEK